MSINEADFKANEECNQLSNEFEDGSQALRPACYQKCSDMIVGLDTDSPVPKELAKAHAACVSSCGMLPATPRETCLNEVARKRQVARQRKLFITLIITIMGSFAALMIVIWIASKWKKSLSSTE